MTDLPGGDIFQVGAADGGKSFYYPRSEELGGRTKLVADVAYVARLRNPFEFDRTLTICNGIHSRGVLGAVRCFTDATVREQNEKYLTDQFPEGEIRNTAASASGGKRDLVTRSSKSESASVRVGTEAWWEGD